MDAIATQPVSIERIRQGSREVRDDLLAVEEPLEIRLVAPGEEGLGRALSVTMRTPGQDTELALGFLYGEGIIRARTDVRGARHCGESGNVMRIELASAPNRDLGDLQRNFYMTSSCGVCGKSSIEAVTGHIRVRRIAAGWQVSESVLAQLPSALRAAQMTFESTGGLHAVGLFDLAGKVVAAFEDVGRHNAFDKLVGSQLLADRLPLDQSIVLLSGRASFELVQKAAAAGVALLVAIGAPSSLAVNLAREAGMTLVGFLRDGNFNIYSHGQRIR